jgi:predicted short-subunit dehydrogenase-like oxidoreductase (DUF2520 family)
VTPNDAEPSIWIIGAGRAGLALAGLLRRRSAAPTLVSGRSDVAPANAVFAGANAARYRPLHDGIPPAARLLGVLLAVPDGVVADLAADLAASALPEQTPVLHLSGVLGSEALAPLAECGHPVGALHPLVSLADPEQGAAQLEGAWFAVEADGAARSFAERVIAVAGGQVLDIAPGGKPLYHASAVFASNYVVALLAAAVRLMSAAGVPETQARAALCQLARGAIDNVAHLGADAALTGPVVRGDVETVDRHLARLSGPERRLYSLLGREALVLASRRGLDEQRLRQLERRFEEQA